MNRKSLDKLRAAGYRIIRCDDNPSPRIKVKGRDSEWATLEKDFPSKAARDRRFNELIMSDPMTIDD